MRFDNRRRLIDVTIRPARQGQTTQREHDATSIPGSGAANAAQQWGSWNTYWLLGNSQYTFGTGLHPAPSRGKAR